MITGATATVLLPLFSKIVFDAKDKTRLDEVLTLWRSALTKSAILTYPIVVFFTFNAEIIVILLYSDLYINSAVYFQIAMVLNFFNVIVFAPLLFALGETKFYSRMHMVFAFIAWGGGYLIVLLFNSPVALAVFSISMAVLRVLVALRYVSKLLSISFISLIPLRDFVILTLHSVLSIVLVKLVMMYLTPELNGVASLIVIFAGFVITLLLTARFLKLDYLSVVKPLIKKGF
jgi:O-antigen/teichoic acid export membrane protein